VQNAEEAKTASARGEGWEEGAGVLRHRQKKVVVIDRSSSGKAIPSLYSSEPVHYR